MMERLERGARNVGDDERWRDDDEGDIPCIFLPAELFTEEWQPPNSFASMFSPLFEKEYVWRYGGQELRFGYKPLQGIMRWIMLGNWGGRRWRETQQTFQAVNEVLKGLGAPQELWDLPEEELIRLYEAFEEATTDLLWQQLPEEFGVYVTCEELPAITMSEV